jgi:hypothetical protein
MYEFMTRTYEYIIYVHIYWYNGAVPQATISAHIRVPDVHMVKKSWTEENVCAHVPIIFILEQYTCPTRHDMYPCTSIDILVMYIYTTRHEMYLSTSI